MMFTAGKSSAISMPMIVMTTSNSTSVKPRLERSMENIPSLAKTALSWPLGSIVGENREEFQSHEKFLRETLDFSLGI